MTSHTLHPTHNAVYILQSSSRWRPDHNSLLSFTTIAQPYIPIYTAHHGRFATHTLSYTFSKIKISKFFWVLSRGRSGFCPHFRSPLLPLHILKFFGRFDLSFRFLLHGTAKELNCTVLRPCCAIPRGDQPMGRSPYMARILSTSPLESVEPNLHRHPYAPTILLL